MRRAFGAFLLIASSASFMAAFQNCAVYKSSDKSGFEGADAQPVRASSVRSEKALDPSITAGTGSDGDEAEHSACAGLISDGEADAAFGRPTERFDVKDAAGDPACMISSFDNVEDGADTAVCSASPANFAQLYVSPEDDGHIVVDPDPSGPMPEGSFGFARQLDEGRVEFVFVGALKGAQDAVACRFAFPSRQKLKASLLTAAQRGSRLARAIAAKRPGSRLSL